MSNKMTLPIFETVSSAWQKVQGAKSVILGVCAMVFISRILEFTCVHINKGISDPRLHALLISLSLVFTLVSVLLGLSLCYLGIQRAFGNKIQFSMIKHIFNLKMFFKTLGVILIKILYMLPSGLLFFAGVLFIAMSKSLSHDTVGNNLHNIFSISAACIFLLGLLVAIYLNIRLGFSFAVLFTEKKSPWAATKTSFLLTKNNFFKLLSLFVMNMIIFLISVIPVGLGLIWSLPYGFINYGVAFDTLSKQYKTSTSAQK